MSTSSNQRPGRDEARRTANILVLSLALMLPMTVPAAAQVTCKKVFHKPFPGNHTVAELAWHDGKLFVAAGGYTDKSDKVLKIFRGDPQPNGQFQWTDVTPKWQQPSSGYSVAMHSFQGMLLVGTETGEFRCISGSPGIAQPVLKPFAGGVADMDVFSCVTDPTTLSMKKPHLFLFNSSICRSQDGVTWQETSSAIPSDVYPTGDGALEVFGNHLYLGYGFKKDQPKEVGIRLLRTSNGQTWQTFRTEGGPLVGVALPPQHLHAMKAFGNYLYLGGYEVTPPGVYRTDGSANSWEFVPFGTATIPALEACSGRLFAGAYDYRTIGYMAGLPILYCTSEGKTWTPVPNVPLGSTGSQGVFSMTTHDGKLYFGTAHQTDTVGGEVFELTAPPAFVQLADSNKLPKTVLGQQQQMSEWAKEKLKDARPATDGQPSKVPDTTTDRPAPGPAPAPSAGHGLHGYVLALDEAGNIGAPIVGATIQFRNQAGQSVGQPITSGPGGYYRANLDPGVYRYKVQASGYKDEDVKRGVTARLSRGYASWDFYLAPGKNPEDKTPDDLIPVPLGRLEGAVLEETSGGQLVAIHDATVYLHNEDGSPTDVSVVAAAPDADGQGAGHYGISLQTGSWLAKVQARGFPVLIDPQPIQIEAGKIVRRNFIFSRPESKTKPVGQGIVGRVRLLGPDATVESLAKVALSIVPVRPLEAEDSTAMPSPPATVTPSTDGQFRRDVEAGVYRVQARLPGYRSAQVSRAVYRGKQTRVDLVLRPVPTETEPIPIVKAWLLRIELVEERERGQMTPVESADFAIGGLHGEHVDARISADPRRVGWFTTRLPAGSYRVFAEKDGYPPAVESVVIAERDTSCRLIFRRHGRPEPGEGPDEQAEPIPERLVDLRVLVLNAENHALPGAVVTLNMGDSQAQGQAPQEVGKSGIVEFQLPRDDREYWVAASLGGDVGEAVVKPHWWERRGRDSEADVVVRIHPRHLPEGEMPKEGEEPDVSRERVALLVQVVNARGQALPRARVTLHHGNGPAPGLRPQITGEGGMVEFRVPRNEWPYFVTAFLGHAGGEAEVPRQWWQHPTPPGEAHVVVRIGGSGEPGEGAEPGGGEPGDIEPGGAGEPMELASLRIQVVSTQGRPLPRAVVKLHLGDRLAPGQQPRIAGEDGMVEFRVPRNEWQYFVTASLGNAGGEAEVPRQWWQRPIPPGQGHAVVRIRLAGGEPSEGIEPGGGEPGGAGEPMELVSLRIQVVNTQGRPLPRAMVRLQLGDRPAPGQQPRATQANGIAEFRVPRNDWQYWVGATYGQAAGEAEVPRLWWQHRRQGPDAVVRIAVGSPDSGEGPEGPGESMETVRLRVRVVNTQGQPLPRATVTLHLGQRPAPGQSTRSAGEDGIAEFQLPRNDWRYWVKASYGQAQGQANVPPRWWQGGRPAGQAHVEVRIPARGTGGGSEDQGSGKEPELRQWVDVRVVHAGSQRGIPSAQVTVMHGPNPFAEARPQRTDGSGNARFQLPPGSYWLQATAQGYRPGRGPLAVPKQGPHDGMVRLEPAGGEGGGQPSPPPNQPRKADLIVQVVSQRGTPIAGAQVRLAGPQPAGGTTDRGGNWHAQLNSGTYTVTVSKQNYNTQSRRGVVLQPGEPAHVKIVLTGNIR